MTVQLRPHSLAAERLPSKVEVMGSIPIEAFYFFKFLFYFLIPFFFFASGKDLYNFRGWLGWLGETSLTSQFFSFGTLFFILQISINTK